MKILHLWRSMAVYLNLHEQRKRSENWINLEMLSIQYRIRKGLDTDYFCNIGFMNSWLIFEWCINIWINHDWWQEFWFPNNAPFWTWINMDMYIYMYAVIHCVKGKKCSSQYWCVSFAHCPWILWDIDIPWCVCVDPGYWHPDICKWIGTIYSFGECNQQSNCRGKFDLPLPLLVYWFDFFLLIFVELFLCSVLLFVYGFRLKKIFKNLGGGCNFVFLIIAWDLI